MTREELETAHGAAKEERDKLQAQLGDVLLSGEDDRAKGSSLTKQLQKAQAKLDEVEYALAAVSRAEEAAQKAAVEKEEREAQEALERMLNDARTDHAELMRRAEEADAAFDAFNQALADLGGACDDFLDRYRPLNFQKNEVSVMRLRGWNGQVLSNFKNHGERSFRNFLQQLNIRPTGTGSKVSIAQRIPEFSRLMTGRSPKKAA